MAARLYRKAADQGIAVAQFQLGACYANGEVSAGPHRGGPLAPARAQAERRARARAAAKGGGAPALLALRRCGASGRTAATRVSLPFGGVL